MPWKRNARASRSSSTKPWRSNAGGTGHLSRTRSCRRRRAAAQRVEALLQAHDDAGSFLDKPLPTSKRPASFAAQLRQRQPADQPTAERPGTRDRPVQAAAADRRRRHGHVYMAEQTQPVRRKVALKVIKPGMDTRQVIARFEAERQALALMDHPNIAKVLDAGTTEAGRPYFVMELVKGVPITEYCDENRLTPRQRLELFVPVCQAIQHAHQKGIIHRDIKPSNVLVALYDGKPVPKVIDFGIAKAIGPAADREDAVHRVRRGRRHAGVHEPRAGGDSTTSTSTPAATSTSLGVLLYELLTGTTPLERQAARSRRPATKMLRHDPRGRAAPAEHAAEPIEGVAAVDLGPAADRAGAS